MEYIISIGTNIGDRKANIEKCIEAIKLLPSTSVILQSAIYETEPVGYEKQDDFYNIVIKVSSDLNPHEMLGACLGIEAGFGRLRTIRFGPRIIDVDLILAEDEVINTDNLVVPHPRYHERRFVLEPMLDLFPNGVAYGIDFKKFIDNIDGQYIKRAEV